MSRSRSSRENPAMAGLVAAAASSNMRSRSGASGAVVSVVIGCPFMDERFLASDGKYD
jgi:hypothetical protein